MNKKSLLDFECLQTQVLNNIYFDPIIHQYFSCEGINFDSSKLLLRNGADLNLHISHVRLALVVA